MKAESRSFIELVLGWSVLALAAMLVGWVVWSYTYPFDIFTAKPGSWVVQNAHKHVARGEPLVVSLDYCVTEKLSPQMDMLIEQDKRLMLLETTTPAATIGCHKVVLPITTIPRVLALESTTAAGDGKATLQVTLRYRINALRTVQYSFQTDTFIIDP